MKIHKEDGVIKIELDTEETDADVFTFQVGEPPSATWRLNADGTVDQSTFKTEPESQGGKLEIITCQKCNGSGGYHCWDCPECNGHGHTTERVAVKRKTIDYTEFDAHAEECIECRKPVESWCDRGRSIWDRITRNR